MRRRILETTTFDLNSFVDELGDAPSNHDVGSRLWFENATMQVWEVKMKAEERGPFHAHTRRYSGPSSTVAPASSAPLTAA